MARSAHLSGLVVAAALAVVAPASAQYHPAPPNWGFGYERYGEVRFLIIRVQRAQGLIQAMDHRHEITGRSSQRLIEEANAIQRHLRNDAAFGLNASEAAEMRGRVARLEQQVDAAYAERDRRIRDPYAYVSDDWRRDWTEDRDRNRRDDRWEDDFRLNAPLGPPR